MAYPQKTCCPSMMPKNWHKHRSQNITYRMSHAFHKIQICKLVVWQFCCRCSPCRWLLLSGINCILAQFSRSIQKRTASNIDGKHPCIHYSICCIVRLHRTCTTTCTLASCVRKHPKFRHIFASVPGVFVSNRMWTFSICYSMPYKLQSGQHEQL